MNYEEVVSRVKVPSKFTLVGTSGITSNKSEDMVDNIPLSGFKFRSMPASYDYPNPVVVEDPRGFTVSLNEEAARQLLLTADISNGEIIDECVWAFVTPLQCRLLPTSNPVYQAVTTDCKVTPRQLKQGDEVKVVGYSGVLTYVGKFYQIRATNYYSPNSLEYASAKTHVFINKEHRRVYNSASPKIFELISTGNKFDLTLSEVNKMFVEHRGSGYYACTMMFTDKEYPIVPVDASVPLPYHPHITATMLGGFDLKVEMNDGAKANIMTYNLPEPRQTARSMSWSMDIDGKTYSKRDIVNLYYARCGLDIDGVIVPI